MKRNPGVWFATHEQIANHLHDFHRHELSTLSSIQPGLIVVTAMPRGAAEATERNREVT